MEIILIVCAIVITFFLNSLIVIKHIFDFRDLPMMLISVTLVMSWLIILSISNTILRFTSIDEITGWLLKVLYFYNVLMAIFKFKEAVR